MNLTPPLEIAAWLGCLAFVVMLINGVMKLVDRVKDKPLAGDVARDSADRYTTKNEFQQHTEWNRREHENLFSKLGGVERGMNERVEARLNALQVAADEGREKLHRRINNQSRMLFLIAGKLGVSVSRDGEDQE